MAGKIISVVIPIYNGREYLPDCFASLAKQTYLPHQVIVVEDQSKDASREFLSQAKIKGTDLKIIYNEKNIGFVRSCNKGMAEALNNGADYIFLLNQDTICDDKCLEKLLEAAELQDNLFALQAMLLWWPQTNVIQTSGDKIHFLGFGHSGDFKKSADLYQNLKIKRITYASGAALFMRASVLKEVGLFDEDLIMYHDDLDLSWRARFLGYQIFVAPQAIVYHKYTDGIVKNRWFWSERNRTLTLLKFYKWPTLILIFLPWLIMELGVLVFALTAGWFSLKIKSYISAIKQLPNTLHARRDVQKTRKIPDRQMVKWIEGRLTFSGFKNPILRYIVNPVFGLYWAIIRRIIWW
ncbi:MAG: glycosyltransferase family 2 protein [Patescibacteria group bacterium]|nr:glycosyltransferase family 2 protein [Patescibacteria group bacterium]MDD5121438.1 glycosyltransferase family 2 protein [Patescibacteria group bacterium]MDD5222289.1 glycosyltransferase family 2 protein [Patescibacteria group bacterium]MDD5395643.1 glycosyltransferase family 2 protein [Patescibacteria group bacterium]